MVKMGRSKHTFHHEHSKRLLNAALNPRDSFRNEQINEGRSHGHNLVVPNSIL
jgi:hypothetical protein